MQIYFNVFGIYGTYIFDTINYIFQYISFVYGCTLYSSYTYFVLSLSDLMYATK